MGSPAVSRFLYETQNSEYKAKVKRMFGEKDRRGTEFGPATPTRTLAGCRRYELLR
jgi:hypothetical protein